MGALRTLCVFLVDDEGVMTGLTLPKPVRSFGFLVGVSSDDYESGSSYFGR